MYDSQTGLYYLNARYYNPTTGRFLSEDPVGPNASNPFSYSEYAYAENNPVNRVDPSGQFSWRWIGNFPRYIAPPSWVYSDFFAANPEFSALEEAELAAWLEGTGNASRMTMNLQRFAQDSNKLNHIFGKSEHNLEEFLQGYEGNQVRAYNALENATQEYVERNGIKGIFEESIDVNGTRITVRGNVVDGTAKIGTAFIPNR